MKPSPETSIDTKAEILVNKGITSALIANEIVDEAKLNHLAEFGRSASVQVAVDNENVVRDVARIQRTRKSPFEVLVETNVGLNRCGVAPGEQAIQLSTLAANEGLKVRGIMGYDGHLQSEAPSPERDRQVREGCKTLADCAASIENSGIPVLTVSTGRTGPNSISGDCPGITGVQAGSYLLMDARFA